MLFEFEYFKGTCALGISYNKVSPRASVIEDLGVIQICQSFDILATQDTSNWSFITVWGWYMAVSAAVQESSCLVHKDHSVGI